MFLEVVLAKDYCVFSQDFDLELIKAAGHFLGSETVLLLELDQTNHKKKQS